MWSYINGLILKKAQNNIFPSKAEINYYPVCFFQNLHFFNKGWRYRNCDGSTILGNFGILRPLAHLV